MSTSIADERRLLAADEYDPIARSHSPILASLQNRVPRPSRGGLEHFTAYRLEREAEWRIKDKVRKEEAMQRAEQDRG